ncbi:sulfite exporter TauE/SafE family protein [Allorhizobium undicola]|uniref:sulfite exporter TauE/SafE family protein n=1 Tax=Allorhizobium undicola TaxID=78527 RepID=UPI000486C730|nr:sulfite exporter TauE/SafE family protein [Allorhizobium undicola]
MSISMIALLLVAGFLSGAINAVAGGGTFLTFGALTLAGLPPISANATSSIVQFPGYITSTLAYWQEIRRSWKSAVALVVVSIMGGAMGALTLLALDNPSFRALVPWLLAGATTLFALGPLLKPKVGSEQPVITPKGIAGQFFTALYGGFFGAGMGIMMLAVLGLAAGGSYHHLNALKNLLAIVIAAIAIIIFVGGGIIAWTQAAIMLPAVALGGYAGVWMARRVPQTAMRLVVIAVGAALTAYYFLTG